MADFTVKTAADTDFKSFGTPQESFLSDSEDKWGSDDESENFVEGHKNIFEVLDDEDDI